MIPRDPVLLAQKVTEFIVWFSSDDPGHEIEIRWNNAYDGSTRWHLIKDDDSVGRSGFYPWQADYRLKK